MFCRRFVGGVFSLDDRGEDAAPTTLWAWLTLLGLPAAGPFGRPGIYGLRFTDCRRRSFAVPFHKLLKADGRNQNISHKGTKHTKDFCNSSINGGRRVFLTRPPGGRRLFVTYQWGKPQLDECENAKGASAPQISH